MTQYKRIGLDTSKAVFTLHGVDQQDRPLLRINLRRPQLLAFLRNTNLEGSVRSRGTDAPPCSERDLIEAGLN